jgi:hypothetical protein
MPTTLLTILANTPDSGTPDNMGEGFLVLVLVIVGGITFLGWLSKWV